MLLQNTTAAQNSDGPLSTRKELNRCSVSLILRKETYIDILDKIFGESEYCYWYDSQTSGESWDMCC